MELQKFQKLKSSVLLLQTAHRVQLMKKDLSRRKSNAHEVSKLLQNKHALELRILEFQRLYAEERKKNVALKNQLESKAAKNESESRRYDSRAMAVGGISLHLADRDQGQTEVNSSEATVDDDDIITFQREGNVGEDNEQIKGVEELEMELKNALKRADTAERALVEIQQGGGEGESSSIEVPFIGSSGTFCSSERRSSVLLCPRTDGPADKAEIALLNNRVLELEAEVSSANTRANEAAQAAIMAAEAAREAAEAADLARFDEVGSF